MSGCNVTINRGDKGTKYVTVLGTDDHEVARELALKEMGWCQTDCSMVTVNPKADDEPNHPTTIEVPVVHEPNFHQDPPSDEVAAELAERDAEPQFPGGTAQLGVESVSASEVIIEVDTEALKEHIDEKIEELTEADNPGETLNFSASDSDDDGASPERLDIEQPGDDQEQPDI